MEFEKFREGYNSWCFNWRYKKDEAHAQLFYETLKHITQENWEVVVCEVLAGLDKFPRIKDVVDIHRSVLGRKQAKVLIEYEPDPTPEQVRFSNKCREYMNMWCEGKIDTLPSLEEIKEELEGVPF